MPLGSSASLYSLQLQQGAITLAVTDLGHNGLSLLPKAQVPPLVSEMRPSVGCRLLLVSSGQWRREGGKGERDV